MRAGADVILSPFTDGAKKHGEVLRLMFAGYSIEAINGSFFNAPRMVQKYVLNAYF